MTHLKVDFITNRNDDGRPQVSMGASIPDGQELSGAGGLSVTGVCTATSFSGDGTQLNSFSNASKGYAIKLIIDPNPFKS